MNKYHPNINLTIEVNLSKLLDTKMSRDNNEIKCFAYHKEMKLPFYLTCGVAKHYKRNVIIGELPSVKNVNHLSKLSAAKGNCCRNCFPSN